MKKFAFLMIAVIMCVAVEAKAGGLIEFNRVTYAAQTGDPSAMLVAGKAFYNGNYRGMEIEHDYDQAFRYLSGGVDKINDSEAEYYLAKSYQYGRGVGQDYNAYTHWLEVAANNGNFAARQELTNLRNQPHYGGGSGPVEPAYHHDPRLDRLMREAEEGNSEAQYQLGDAYLHGSHGLRHDDNAGFHWVHRAAELGYGPAARRLVTLYHTGQGTQRNDDESREWDRRARHAGY